MIDLSAEEVMRLTVKVAAPKIVVKTNNGFLQVIPIIGRFFTGKALMAQLSIEVQIETQPLREELPMFLQNIY